MGVAPEWFRCASIGVKHAPRRVASGDQLLRLRRAAKNPSMPDMRGVGPGK